MVLVIDLLRKGKKNKAQGLFPNKNHHRGYFFAEDRPTHEQSTKTSISLFLTHKELIQLRKGKKKISNKAITSHPPLTRTSHHRINGGKLQEGA